MTTRRPGGRDAVTHYVVKRKLDTVYGKFALLELKIETGRTHQIACICRRFNIRWSATRCTARRAS